MKRISLGAKGQVVLTQMAVLTESQAEKLESSQLRKKIEELAKRLKFRWYIENNGQHLMLCCSRTFITVEDADMHDLEMQQDTFLSEIDKMELDIPEEKEDEKLNEDIVELMHNIIGDEEIICAELIVLKASPIGRVVESRGRISKPLLNEMCQAWLDTHKQA